MKILVLASFCLVSLTACQLISPLVTDYNGVRMDVAKYINQSWYFGLKERNTLVEYAKGQQQVLAWQRLTSTEQQQLAQARAIGRYCASQHVSFKKLNLVDNKIFYDAEQKQKLDAMYSLQSQLALKLNNTHCQTQF